MPFLLLTATLTCGDTATRISGPSLPVSTPPEQALAAFDELYETLQESGWGVDPGRPLKIAGRVHLADTADAAPQGAAICVFAASGPEPAAARRRAVAALLAAQAAAAADAS